MPPSGTKVSHMRCCILASCASRLTVASLGRSCTGCDLLHIIRPAGWPARARATPRSTPRITGSARPATATLIVDAA
eukprot:scaffold13620_cov35-Tisochrysis_lutea.AAC.1